jgi:hypothetical protein
MAAETMHDPTSPPCATPRLPVKRLDKKPKNEENKQ